MIHPGSVGKWSKKMPEDFILALIAANILLFLEQNKRYCGKQEYGFNRSGNYASLFFTFF